MTEVVRCSESVWTLARRGEPCGKRARWLVMDPSTGMQDWRPLCGTHANTDRWANYPSLEWKEIAR